MMTFKVDLKRHTYVILAVCLLLMTTIGTGCLGRETKGPTEALERSIPWDDVSKALASDQTPQRALTTSEVEAINQAFAQLLYPQGDSTTQFQYLENPDTQAIALINPVCHFFTSEYTRPEDIELNAFIRYFESDDTLEANNEADVKEFEALRALEAFPFNAASDPDATLDSIPVPIQRKTVKSVNAVLQKYADISVDQLTRPDDVIYLKAPYDAFYTYTSDFGPGIFTCSSGTIEGDVLTLHGTTWSDKKSRLILHKKDNRYLFYAHTTTDAH